MNEFINTNTGEEPDYSNPVFITEPTGLEFYYLTKDKNARVEKVAGGYVPAYQYYSRIHHGNKWVSAHSQEWQECPIYKVYENLEEAIAIAKQALELHKLAHLKLHFERCLYLK